MSDLIKEQLKKIDRELKLKPRNLVDGDPQLYVQISSPLNGMLPSIAYLRLIRFAKPIFITSMVLSLLSLFGNKQVQEVIVNAVMGTISLTLIKLIIYLNMIICGLSFAISKRSIAASFQTIGGYLCDISFDCTSIGIGAIAGIYPAACISAGLVKMTLGTAWALSILVTSNLLMWGFANIRIFAYRVRSREEYKPWMKPAAGLLLIIFAAISLNREPWMDVPALHPAACPATAKAKN